MTEVTERLAGYIAGAGARELPPEVAERAALHTLDTLAAMVSGAGLEPGRQGIVAAGRLAGPGHATVVGGGRADVVTAALANGMSAHADETDDSHPPSTTHPGAAVVPAAVAVAQQNRCDVATLLRAVVTGYDVGTRVVLAMRFGEFHSDESSFSTHAIGGVFGAAAAASVAAGLGPDAVRAALALAAQSASGLTTWLRDPEHVEKAFVFGGMPASNGVRAALLAELGCRGVPDVFSTGSNVLSAFSADPRPAELVDGLGTRFEVMRTAIKKFAVGSPAQAAVQAAVDLVAAGLRAEDVAAIEIVLPRELVEVVDGRDLPVINVQYLVAATLLDGGFSFEMAHSPARMRDPGVTALMDRTELVADPALLRERVATLRVRRADGSALEHTVPGVRGGPADPMPADEVIEKAADLVGDRARAERLAEALLAPGTAGDSRDLHHLIVEPAPRRERTFAK